MGGDKIKKGNALPFRGIWGQCGWGLKKGVKYNFDEEKI
jgi:hypothetical protein